MSLDLNDPTIKDAIKAAALDVASALKAEEAKKAEAVKAEETKVQDAITAAKAEWEKEAAKSQRLPFNGQAPHVTAFADTNKYDGMSAADLAFMGAMLSSRKTGNGLSKSAAKALLIKVAEGKAKNDAENNSLIESKSAAKALGIDLEGALSAAKANELDYSTQSGFGDEFVPTVWSSNLWEQIRFGQYLVSKVPSVQYNGPGDTFTIPLEGADPTFYKVGQATDLNATTGRPDATIGDSKVATSNTSVTFAKMAARVGFTGEIDEDSIIPFAARVRAQTEMAFIEQLEHVVIDGDTATGATTNINHIGGTPTSTGTKQDLFLLLNGFRKLALVTNTANSVSAAGSLADTTFLEVLKLLGPAGMNADPQKVSFIIDANVYWKVQQLVSLKTRDVFTAATLENGMFAGIWGYEVLRSPFMHWRSTTNPRKANTAGKVDLTTQGNNTTGSILAVRWDQWLLGYKRNITMKMQDIPDSDASQIIATARLGMVNRDTEASAIAYNVGV